MNAWPIGVFDSGAGGLSVLEACRALLPREDFIYLSDARHAPYGNKADAEIAGRVFTCCERLINLNCKAIVVACNTATGVGIRTLRERYERPFVGLEPAIKPAIEAGFKGEIVLFCTEATARQEKFLKLLGQFQKGNGEWGMGNGDIVGADGKPSESVGVAVPGDPYLYSQESQSINNVGIGGSPSPATPTGRNVIRPIPDSGFRTPNPESPSPIIISPQKNLAALIENHFDNLDLIRPQVYDILSAHKNAAAIILGCTHYVFVREMILDFYREQGCEIRIFDGNAGAARRLKSLLKQGQLLTNRKTAGGVRLILG
ncbi:MAG: aspartate/glutamate racemase family protein [Firmicutes bacterium]|nr:aspartate/glutamate racemase family protein [Bacillota bacterium]